jgi:hypothetical protein
MTEIGYSPASLVNVRARRDLVTNPAYDEMLELIAQTIAGESDRLVADAKQDLDTLRFQSGTVHGAKLVHNKLKDYRVRSLEATE